MKMFAGIVVSVSLLCSAAGAAQPRSALAVLLSQAQAPAAALPVPPPPEKALASDVLDLTDANADFLAAYAAAGGYAVLELDGARMRAKRQLLDYTTRMLRLPGIPENWDAMIDYIGDLPGIHHNNHILIVVRNSNLIRMADAALYADFREVAEFACRNAREWSKGDITIKFAFVP